MEKCPDVSSDATKLQKLAEEIEIAMFGEFYIFNGECWYSSYYKRVFPGTFGDVGAKYKNKYRSLTYNIKDPKNDGLFRRIATRDLSPIEVISFVKKNVCSNMVWFTISVPSLLQ